jgi:hypothetical protein
MPRDFVIGCGEYSIECTPSGLPGLYDLLKAHAALAEEIALDERDLCCLAVRRGAEAWPFLTVALGCGAAAAGGSPGALLALDAGTLFIGYGTRALAIRMHPLGRLWSSDAPFGFALDRAALETLGAATLATLDDAAREKRRASPRKSRAATSPALRKKKLRKRNAPAAEVSAQLEPGASGPPSRRESRSARPPPSVSSRLSPRTR